MPRGPKETGQTPPADNSSQLLHDQLDDLTAALNRVADQVQVLRQILDEVRDDFSWALKNDLLRCPSPCVPLTSMPKDPLAADFGERLNRFTAADLHPDDASPPTPGDAPKRQALCAK